MITYTDPDGQTWTLNLTVCVPVFLFATGPLDPETGEPETITPLPGVRLDVAPAGLHPSLEPFVVYPSVRRHDFGAGATAIFAPDWSDLFFPDAPIWRRVEEDDQP
ncbi:hypothetical protein [Phenylobacterium sp.]|uniref:hypothetical protein n=1 Tax=Phenylobacterium sp. TaxID=1871053 RepID=UPI002731D496|nr:hypothetical protein [Phenylobacterium sp.]MDP2214996.1 hypothetical protein [Phenylobacterium sp.]